MGNRVILRGRTYSDDADPNTGLDNNGHRKRFIPLLQDFVGEAADRIIDMTGLSNQAKAAKADAEVARQQAQQAAASAILAPGTLASSNTELTIGAGPATLAIAAGKALVAGMYVMLTCDRPDHWMHGQIDSHNSSTGQLVVRVTSFVGSGKSAAWLVTPAPALPVLVVGNRISGDFSNGRHSLRTLFQTSAPNGNTNVGIIPNGSGNTARLTLFASADPDNASFLRMGANLGDSTFFDSTNVGASPVLPMLFLMNGVEAMRLATDRKLLINTPSISSATLQVAGGLAVRDGPLQMFQGTALTGMVSLSGGAVRVEAFSGNAVHLAIANTPIAAVTTTGVTVTGRIEASGAIVAQNGMTVNGNSGLYVHSAITTAGNLSGANAAIADTAVAKRFESRAGAIGQQTIMHSYSQANGAVWPTVWNHVVEGDLAYALYSYDNNGGAPFRALALQRAGHMTVSGEFAVAGRVIQAGVGAPGECQIRFQNSARFTYFYLSPDGNMGLFDATAGISRWTSDTAGNFWVAGTLSVAGNVVGFSDIRLKTDITRLTGALDKIRQISGYQYRRIDTNKQEVGLMAHEVATVQPELTGEHNGYLTLAYGNAAALLVEAVKELDARLNQLEGNK